MLATETPKAHPIHHPNSTTRRPLQPKNTIHTPTPITNHPKKCHIATPISVLPFDCSHSNKENFDVFTSPIESSLAEELTAVRKKLERLKLDKEKTEKMFQERDVFLDFQLFELEERGEFQRELEIEVDRLYRLKQLKLFTTRMSPLRSLREKAMEKKSKEAQFDNARKEDTEEMVDQSSTTECSSRLSMESSYASASTSASTSNSTATSKLSLTSEK